LNSLVLAKEVNNKNNQQLLPRGLPKTPKP